MAASVTSSVPSLPLPCPKSPPRYPDLYGKRRELVKVQMIEREIGFLEEELKSLEDLPPSSRCCKEVGDFVGDNPDPLISVDQKIRRSHRIWKWLCGKSCFNLSWICCSSNCSLHLELPSCCSCQPSIAAHAADVHAFALNVQSCVIVPIVQKPGVTLVICVIRNAPALFPMSLLEVRILFYGITRSTLINEIQGVIFKINYRSNKL
ncbi:hypothetical protein NE237_028772 [Protea cynaroides]|uniref:G protein gamma domain-containing protein n=1 Tax=Protea cynaroides TaxID=273540 RepID=A0A9Q0GT19_9MAGN|nr:hypothetical protein NE237_028772 [Protea cynaroides]